MAIQKIELGTEPHGVGGDSYRTANEKINSNFEEVGKDIQDALDRDVTLRQDLANPDKGATMVGYGEGTVADKLDEIVSGAVTEPFVNERVYTHNHDANAHTELRTRIVSEVTSHVNRAQNEAERAQNEAERAEAASDAALSAVSGGGLGIYSSEVLGIEGTVEGDMFWVFPNIDNDLDNLVLYQNSSSTAVELYEQNNLNQFMYREEQSYVE